MAGYRLYDCQPSAREQWLLEAALGETGPAGDAWDRWRSEVALDDVDPASYRLLPIVYRHLTDRGVSDATMQRLKGVYRHTWFKNQTLFRAVEEIVACFGEAGISTLVLKGATLAARYYGEEGVRSMQDIDLMVPRDAFLEAVDRLLSAGWEPFPYSRDTLRWYHETGFKHGCGFRKGVLEVDLHEDLFRFMPQITASVWEAAEPWDWRGHRVYRPCDTDQLFHTCVHGVRWSFGYLSWIADALAILDHPETRIDWPRLLQLAENSRTAVYLVNALGYLHQAFAAPIPTEVLHALATLPTSWVERQEHRVLARRDHGNPLVAAHRVFLLASRYRAVSRGTGGPVPAAPTGWLKFLRVQWLTRSLAASPGIG